MPNLEDKLTQLSEAELKILQALAISWEIMTVADFLQLVRAVGVRTENGSPYNTVNFGQLRSHFVALGLIEQFRDRTLTGYQIATPALREKMTRDAIVSGWFETVLRALKTVFSLAAIDVRYDRPKFAQRVLRDHRLNLFREVPADTSTLANLVKLYDLQEATDALTVQHFLSPFQAEEFSRLSRPTQATLLPSLVGQAIELGESTSEIWEFVDANDLSAGPLLRAIRVDELIFKGELDTALELIGERRTVDDRLGTAAIALLRGNFDDATRGFFNAVEAWRLENRKRKGFPSDWKLFIYALALFRKSPTVFFDFAEQCEDYFGKPERAHFAAQAIEAVAGFLRDKEEWSLVCYNAIRGETVRERLLRVIVASIVPSLPLSPEIALLEAQSEKLGFHWILGEIENLFSLRSLKYNHVAPPASYKPVAPLSDLIPRLDNWERALNTLVLMAEKAELNAPAAAVKVDETRVAWLLDFDAHEIQPVEQKFSRNGWTDGRNVALKKLFDNRVNNLTEQDERAAKRGLKRYADYYRYSSYQYTFVWEKTIPELVGHPFLFLKSNPSVSVQLIDSEPALVIKEAGSGVEISFDTKFSEVGAVVRKETETRYHVVRIDKQHVEINSLLKDGKLNVPPAGRERLMTATKKLATTLAIHSDLEEHLEDLPSVEPDQRVHALITPVGDAFHVEFFAKPFGTVPPYFKPGKGTETVTADVDGVRKRTRRDLDHERRLVEEIEAMCPLLGGSESLTYEWELADAGQLLEVLVEFDKPRKDGLLAVEWTKGKELRLVGSIGFENLSLTVKGKNEWFEVGGEAVVSEDLVLSLRELNNLLTPDGRNFIELSDGEFVAITAKLRKRLEALKAILDDTDRIHKLRSGLLEEFSDDVFAFETDAKWRAHIDQIKSANEFVPELPSTFDADLRPYQLEGFNWLSRLAHWGVGACLADDMGLGKTLQAMAILVERAAKGPALVVAPVSVCRNWLAEARRFAPTLNFHLFGAGDRSTQVTELGAFDVLVTSYNLLQFEEELFAGREFATIVLDEAQAFKNRNTKRSRAVMNLQGDFRLLTTGTPIENHLGELWNLFNFINPGLLGTYEFFQERFAVPIERNNDEVARRTLHRLITPFVLRRRKNQVLEDLPAKTEIVLTVEMSDEERAFYEAVRRDALARIDSDKGDAKDKRFRILAELTRLRLACCHPRLVTENIPLGSSKLDLFAETLEELLENKHKALVFSQFVKHLAIVREHLDKQGISYQYLDGSTPPNVRQDRIDRFQRGEGDVFLISLKAGGTGLNLTAADYVIHLDPWWNPAVEDQATDRAHRIGQLRPVTVYRLVTENTVEEKILKLHETKRDLADSLLEETDASGRLSADDLLALISET